MSTKKRMFLFSVEKFDFLIDGRAKSSIDKFIATNPKFEAICEELQTYNGYVDQVPISPIFYEQLFRTKVFCAVWRMYDKSSHELSQVFS